MALNEIKYAIASHYAVCDACGIYPIEGIRYKCFECEDYDLCEGCKIEGHHGHHQFTEINYRFYIPKDVRSRHNSGESRIIYYDPDPSEFFWANIKHQNWYVLKYVLL